MTQTSFRTVTDTVTTKPRGTPVEMPRERLRVSGGQALSDTELIAALVGNGDAAMVFAREVLAAYGDLPSLTRSDLAELEKKVGCAKACTLVAALELGRRAQAPRAKRPQIRVSSDVDSLLGPSLRHLKHEVFHALCLDAKHNLLRDARIVEGGLTSCSVLPREAFAPAIAAGASAVIFVHCHPSGNPAPSYDDKVLTARLKAAGGILGVKALDHVIIADGGYYSFVDEGEFAGL